MTETAEKFGRMRREAKWLKAKGVERADRREVVLAGVAKGNSWDESAEVIGTMINKYWEIDISNPKSRVIVVAPHGREPGVTQAAEMMKEMFPEVDRKELAKKYERWLGGVDAWGEKLNPDDNVTDELGREMVDSFVKFRKANSFEPETLEMVEALGGNTMKAKKTRYRGDANRQAFSKENQTIELEVGGQKFRIMPREYGTAARLALYFGIWQAATEMGIVGEDGRISEDLMVVFLHGMVNSRAPQDVVLGGGSRREGGDVLLMDPKLLRWIPHKLAGSASELSLKVGGENMRVGVHVLGRWDIATYGVGEKGVECRTFDCRDPVGDGSKKKVKRFAATVLGELRTGFGREVKILREVKDGVFENSVKAMTLGGFGERLHLVQLELTEKVRRDDWLRRGMVGVISELRVGFEAGEWREEEGLLPDPF